MLTPLGRAEETPVSAHAILKDFPIPIFESDGGCLTWSNLAFDDLLSLENCPSKLTELISFEEGYSIDSLSSNCPSAEANLIRKKNGSVRVRITRFQSPTQSTATLYLIENRADYYFIKERFLKSQRGEALGALAAAVCHEFNNFLTPLVLASQFLKSQGLPKNQLKFADVIENSSQRASELVHQILELARHTKKDKIELKPRLLVKEMEKFLLSTLPKTVLVQSSLCVDEPTVHASPSHLFQSLLNLSLLAYSKTLSPRCSISLEINTVSKNRKRYARISVEGKRSAGQYPQTTLRSLQEFCSEITAVPQETAYSSIELLAADSCGTFTIEEDQPHRYAASIELPIQTTETIIEKASAEKRNANESKNRIQNKQSIIIVDPDANVRDMLAEHLTSKGYVCHNAVDGAEALMMAGRLGDDLCSIFCELELSHIDGATLANALREKTDVHVHAFTASERQFKEAVKNRDLFQSVSKKPIQISRLEDLIQPYDSIKSESASS